MNNADPAVSGLPSREEEDQIADCQKTGYAGMASTTTINKTTINTINYKFNQLLK